MNPAKSVGRVIGALLVVQLAGLIVPFVMLDPLMRGTQYYLANAAGSPLQIKLAVFLLLANCALTVGISLATWPVFRQHSGAGALLLVAAGVVVFALQAVDNAHLMSMLSLSQQYTQAGGPDEPFQTFAAVVGTTRRWTHYHVLLTIDSWIFAFYVLLFRFRLVPRALAGFGLLTVLLHFAAIPLPMFLGYRGVTPLGVPMALSHIALAVWLIARGLESPARPAAAEPGLR